MTDTKLSLPLEYLFKAAAGNAPHKKLLILMHGIGSNEADLFGLTPYIPTDFHVLSIRGPVSLGGSAFAWFAVQFTPTGRIVDEEQEARSRGILADTISLASTQLGVATDDVIVGGFSQGAIMSVSMLLTKPQLFSAAMALHGRFMPQINSAIPAASEFAGKRIWVSGGTDDNVVAFSESATIRDRALALGIDVTFREYPGAHEIRPAELNDAVEWLSL